MENMTSQSTCANYNYTVNPSPTENNTYRLITIADNETCILSSKSDLFFDAFFKENGPNVNNRTHHKESQVLLVDFSDVSPDNQNYTSCVTDMKIKHYYPFANSGMNDRMFCKIEEYRYDDSCMCDTRQSKLQVANVIPCWCQVGEVNYYETGQDLINITYFRRNCTIIASNSSKNPIDYLLHCTFHNKPFPIEKIYFNISDTAYETTPSIVTDNIKTGVTNTISTTSSTNATSTTSSISTTKSVSSILTSETNLSPRASEHIQSTSASQTALTTSSHQFTESFIRETNSTTSHQTTHYTSPLVLSTILKEHTIYDTEANAVTLNSLQGSISTKTTDGTDIAQQAKLRDIANANNCTFIANPIFLLLLFFIHFFIYYGFLRKEYINLNSRRK